MPYGLTVIGEDANGTYTVSDTEQILKPMIVANVGQGNSVALPSSGKYLLYANQKGLYGSIPATDPSTATRVTVDTNTNIAYFWYASGYSISDNGMGIASVSAAWASGSCKYIVLAESDSLTRPAGDSYGLKIDDASGNELFDSSKITINDSFRILGEYTYDLSYSAFETFASRTMTSDSDMFVEMAPYTETRTSSTATPDTRWLVGPHFESTEVSYTINVGSQQFGKYYGSVTFGKLLYNPTNITAGKPGGWTQPY